MSNAEFGQGEGALKQIADRVNQAKDEFKNHSSTLDGQIQGMAAKWVGEGGAAFRQLHQAWLEKHTTITNALDKFRDSLEATERDNVSTDADASASLANLQNKLG